MSRFQRIREQWPELVVLATAAAVLFAGLGGDAFARTCFGLNVAARLSSAVEGNSGPW